MSDQKTDAGALVLAIDAGGTAVKVALLDAGGTILAQRNAAVRTQHYPDGRVERDADAFWQATAHEIRELVADLDVTRLRAVGCTGFGNGLFVVDGAGRPLRPGIVSIDHRAQHLVDRIEADGRATRIAALNGNRPWGGQTVIQLANLAETEPELMEAARWALSCKDYLRFCLTGEALTDPTDASGGGLMHLGRRDYASEVLTILDHPGLLAKLPPVVASSAIAGRVSAAGARQTGLPEGLPVAGGMMDVAACALGAGVQGDDRMVMIAGTWAINGIEVAGRPGGQAPILNMLHRDGAAWLVAEGSPSSAANLGWYLDRVAGEGLTATAALALADQCPVDMQRCHFLPFVHGPAPRQGAFLGLTASDNQASMVRAICEGVAFQHRRHAEAILPYARGGWPTAVRLTGGAARSAQWAQIFADVCQRPVEVVSVEEVGALGAAICAAVAGGLYVDLPAATAAMSRIGRVHQPNRAHAGFYDDRYQKFLRLDRGMTELLAAGG